MSKFFEKVATPDARYQQTAQPSGPSVDVNARARAQNDYNNNLGSAIKALVGTVGTVTQTVKTIDEAQMERMRLEKGPEAEADSSGYIDFLNSYTKDGKSISQMEPSELEEAMGKATDDFVKANKLSEKDYFDVTKEMLDTKRKAFFTRQLDFNNKLKKEKNYDVLSKKSAQVFDTFDTPENAVEHLKNTLEEMVGQGEKTVIRNGKEITFTPPIQDSDFAAKQRMLEPIVKSAMIKKDPKYVKILESKEVKEFFDIPEYDNVLNSVKQQVQSTINRNKQMSFDRIEEAGYTAMDAGLFKTPKDVDDFFKDQLEMTNEEDIPETKRIMKLKSDFMNAFQSEATFQDYYQQIKGGDFTLLERSDLEKKEKDFIRNKFFSVETGIQDMSPQGISLAIKSGQHDSEIKSFFNQGYDLPPHLEKWANTPPSGGIQGMRDKHETFLQLNALTQDTNKTTLDLFQPKEYGRMMFLGNLFDNINSGTMDEKEALQVYSSFNNDLEKNVDSFGVFTSSKAATISKSEDVQKWLDNKSTDASWTIDEFSDQAYRRRQFQNYFNYAIETTDDTDQAMELAEKMFDSRHVEFENPDGSEGTMPNEFKQFRVNDFVRIAESHPDFQPIKQAAGYLGLAKDYDFRSNLSFRPDPSYEKNKLMNFYYDGKFVLSVSSENMENNLGILNRRKVREAEQRNIQRTQNFQEEPNKEWVRKYK